jgi:uncharacterized membrane protein YhaH (DUF805 family)
MTNYPPPPSSQPVPGGPVPLWAPYYGATLPIAFKRFWQKYATFSGRASRSEYWWWVLIEVIVWAILQILFATSVVPTFTASGHVTFSAGYFIYVILATVWGLGTLIPNIAIVWRRLHDANFAGPFWFLGLIPFVGWIIVLIFTVLPSNQAGSRFDRPE